MALSTRFLSVITRLLFWYSLATVVFRCPHTATQLNDDHPQLCTPYLQARSTIEPQIRPYLEPLYTTYAAPYVHLVEPYASKAYSNVYLPTSTTVNNLYLHHVSPAIADAQTVALKQWKTHAEPHVGDLPKKWEIHVQPYIDDFLQLYKLNVEPILRHARSNVGPWLDVGRKTVIKQYYSVLIPAYHKALPYASRTYAETYHYTSEYVLPSVKQGVNTVVVFGRRHIWSNVRILYGRHIEPQIAKIRVRLTGYIDGRRIQAAANEVEDVPTTSSSKSLLNPVPTGASSILSSMSSSVSMTVSEISSVSMFETVVPTSTPPVVDSTSSHTIDLRHSTVPSAEHTMHPTVHKPADDISKWRSKFTRAAEQATQDLQVRVSDIIARESSAGLGEALLAKLTDESDQAVDSVKNSIIEAVNRLPEDDNTEQKASAMHEVLETLRASGKSLKDRAQQVRTWKVEHDGEIDSLVETAIESTMSILDGIRDLGLQRIGMTWSDSDSVTYEDWTAYHHLKKTFDNLRADVLSSAVDQEALLQAKARSDEVQNNAMNIAGNAAKVLARLKDVAKWKIDAGDASNDFESRFAPVAAAKELGQKVAGFFSGEEKESDDSVMGSLAIAGSEISSSLTETASAISESLSSGIEDMTAPAITVPSSSTPVVSQASETAEGVLDHAASLLSSAGMTAGEPATLVKSSSSDSETTAVTVTSEAIHSIADSILPGVDQSADIAAESFTSVAKITPTDVQEVPSGHATAPVSKAVDDETGPEDVQSDLSSSIPSSARASVVSVASEASEVQAGATILPSAVSDAVPQSEDVVNAAHQASASLYSRINEAGTGFADMTSSLAASRSAATASV